MREVLRNRPPRFESVDESGPYTRTFHRVRVDPDPADRGPWVDLRPDEVDHELERMVLRGGHVRARLLLLGISKMRWSAAEPGVRAQVKAAIVAVDWVERAIEAALQASDGGAPDPSVAVAAASLLERAARLINVEERGGFVRRFHRDEAALIAGDVLEKVEYALEAAREGIKSGRTVAPAQLQQWADHINLILKKCGVRPLQPMCRTSHVVAVKQRRPLDVAIEIVSAAAGYLSEDDLRRSRPRSPRHQRPSR